MFSTEASIEYVQHMSSFIHAISETLIFYGLEENSVMLKVQIYQLIGSVICM